MPLPDDTAQNGPLGSQEDAESDESAVQTTHLAPEAGEEQAPLTRQERLERESGRSIWLALAIGAAGLLLMLLLPWVNVYYLNPMQNLSLEPDGSISFSKNEAVHVVLSGWQLLTSDLWPFLLLVLLTILLLGTVIYWRQTRFVQARIAWLALALSLIVGVGFPIELQQMLTANQHVSWTNTQATIENNAGHTFDKSGAVYICVPKDRNDHSCDKDYSHGIILNAGIDWKEITPDKQRSLLVQGHADGVRAAYNSAKATTSGYAIGNFGVMGASYGYWLSWIFSLLVLLNALILLRRLLRTRR